MHIDFETNRLGSLAFVLIGFDLESLQSLVNCILLLEYHELVPRPSICSQARHPHHHIFSMWMSFFLFIFLQGPPGINNGIDTSHPFASGKAENLLSRLLSSRTAPRGPARPRRHPESVNWGKKSPH